MILLIKINLMMIIKRSWIVLFSGLLMCNCTSNTNEILIAKKAVQKVFELSLKDNIDSLKILLPGMAEWGWSNEYFLTQFSVIKFSAQKYGIPTLGELQAYEFDPNVVRICTIRYIPKPPNIVGIDSILFSFDKYEGNDKISTFEVFEKPKLLKRINR